MNRNNFYFYLNGTKSVSIDSSNGRYVNHLSTVEAIDGEVTVAGNVWRYRGENGDIVFEVMLAEPNMERKTEAGN